MNILIANDATVVGNWNTEGWAATISHFGGKKLMQTLATLVVVQNDVTEGESYDDAIESVMLDLIDAQTSIRREAGSPRPPTDVDITLIVSYLKHSLKQLRPYIPDKGYIELVTYLTDPKEEILYLVVRLHPENEHSSKAFAGPGVRG